MLFKALARDGRKTVGCHISALDKAVGEQGAVVVLLIRLSLIFPFSLLNYGLMTRQTQSLCIMSWVGDSGYRTLCLSRLYRVESDQYFCWRPADLPASNWLFYLGLGATAVLTVAITRIATRALNSKLEEANVGDTQ